METALKMKCELWHQTIKCVRVLGVVGWEGCRGREEAPRSRASNVLARQCRWRPPVDLPSHRSITGQDLDGGVWMRATRGVSWWRRALPSALCSGKCMFRRQSLSLVILLRVRDSGTGRADRVGPDPARGRLGSRRGPLRRLGPRVLSFQ